MAESLPRIGIFDSGIGGFSVFIPCLNEIPARYYYYGDNVRAPYGSRAPREITEFVFEAFSEFEKRGVDAAVIACNTATAVCAEALRKRFSFPILGIEPAVKPAAARCRRFMILATPRTAESRRLAKLLKNYPKERYEIIPLRNLAQEVEEHLLFGKPLYLRSQLPSPCGFDGAVLGCTHYSLIKDEIADFLGIELFDGAEGTVRHLKEVLGLAISDHLKPQGSSAVYLTENYIKWENSEIIFLGSGKIANKSFFDLNIRFRKT